MRSFRNSRREYFASTPAMPDQSYTVGVDTVNEKPTFP